jgi:acetyl-CoA carboxylase carboxyltransferase component
VVVGEKVSLEELGGARMHCSESGCGDFLVPDDQTAVETGRRFLSYLPVNHTQAAPAAEPRPPAAGARPIADLVPPEPQRGYDMRKVIEALVDEGSWLEVKKLFAREILVGLARLGGRAVGIVANQPMQKGGVLFNDSADKAARFIWLCDAFNVPLLFLADVPGFMIGTDVERRGIIRHGAKMITAVAEATVPKISVIVRKAYGAGLYAMAGPAFDTDCVIALPSAQIAVMGPEPAVNAVFYNQLAGLPEDQRATRRKELEEEYRENVDLYKLAANLIVDDVVEPDRLRNQLIARFQAYESRWEQPFDRKHGVPPVYLLLGRFWDVGGLDATVASGGCRVTGGDDGGGRDGAGRGRPAPARQRSAATAEDRLRFRARRDGRDPGTRSAAGVLQAPVSGG